MPNHSPTPDPKVISKLEAVEEQLVEAIHTLCAVEALAEAWREAKSSRPELLGDHFLFGTVYNALWDSLVVALGRIWDDDKRSASLPALAMAIKGTDGAVDEREYLRKGVHPQRAPLYARRIHVVAHRSHPLPEKAEDTHVVDTVVARNDVTQIMDRLRLLSERLGRAPMHWGHTFIEARENARTSLERWRRGDPEGHP